VPAGREGEHAVATNRRARHDYLIDERFEAGIVLTGSEVKSLRGGRASLGESYARVQNGEVWIENLHIPPYESGQKRGYDPKRRRKLLLKRAEIERLVGKTAEKGLTLVPTKMYFKDGRVKLEVGLARGKKLYDKREAEMRKTVDRETRAALKERNR